MLHPRVPRSMLRTSRTEHDALRLELIAGSIPRDLHGHLFVVAPAGTFRPQKPSERTTLMLGDGLISRFDLDPRGITVTSRLAQTHDFVADEITSRDDDLALYRFASAGLVRLGFLGTRDFANTAFLPFTPKNGPTRMLVTYDAGRPVEIDPVSLRVLGPIGSREEWRPEALREAPFPIILTPAHPVWDRKTSEMFTINYGRGVSNFAATIPIVHLLDMVPEWAERALQRAANVWGVGGAFRAFTKSLERITTKIDRAAENFFDRYLPDVPDTFTDLARWNGEGRIERFRLMLDGDREVRIVQSVHQIAVTRDHVIVLETGFKIGFASAFNDPAPREPALDRLMRAVLTRPQLPNTIFYVVPRKELDRRDLPIGDDGARLVRAVRVELPLEADHFLADYDDANGRITLHVAHSPATDLGEWVRPYDESAFGAPTIDDELRGMLAVGAMDVGRFGRYVVDAKSGAVVESRTLLDEERSWAISLYAGSGLNTDDAIPDRIDHLYWCTEGFFPELLTDFVFDLYESYPHRMVPVESIRKFGAQGKPSAVLRIDTNGLRFGDAFQLPPGVMAGSMQLVPRINGGGGYLVGTVYTEERTELWIFDAEDLARGPVARLASRDLSLGFSLHTAWLPHVAPHTSSYLVSARSELDHAVDDPRLRAAFERDLYPRFD